MTVVAAFLTGCQDNVSNDCLQCSRPQRVGFYAGGAQTRTEMLDNGLSTEWVADDEIAVWAKNSSGSFVLSCQTFRTYATDSARGFFTSDLAEAMLHDIYTYYCCYPVPASVNGTDVTFAVPAVQDGKVSAGADIMIADPVQYGALTPVPEMEDHSGMSMRMNRMMHQFRFYIPAENSAIADEKLERVVLTFPSGVAGNVTLDLADPESPAVLENASSMIELRLAEPLGVSSDRMQYACVAFVPKQFAAGESLQVKAYTSDSIAEIDPIDLCARNFQAGHSTPVMLNVRMIKEYPYKMTFTVSENNLGEGVNSIILTAPQGCSWDESGSNVFRYTPGHKIGAQETFNVRFENESQYRAFSGKDISVTFDSDNAITYQTVRIPDISSVDAAQCTLRIPYLFFEDFSGIPSFSDGHDNPTVGTASDTFKDISELSSYASGLSDWYGSRVGGQSGTSIRICCRYEHVLLAGAYYKGRVYTPFLSNIKDGSNVKISVSFRYGSDISERKPLFGSAPQKNPLLFFGINTEDTVTNPDAIEGGLVEGAAGLIGGTGFASWTDSSLNPRPVNAEELPISGGSYTTFTGTKNVVIENVDNGMRLGWIVSTNNSSSNTNGNYWIYLDDIKVQIVND